MRSKRLFFLSGLFLLFNMINANALASEINKPQAPIIVTTCGQSPGALMIKLIAKRAKLECFQENELKPGDLKDGKYKTLIITMGTSLKGMGAAGTSIEDEADRVAALIKEARHQGMTVIGAHIEGMARRVDKSDETSINAVAPNSDILIVIDESNSDGYFSKLSKDKNIPLYSAKQALRLKETFQKLFNGS